VKVRFTPSARTQFLSAVAYIHRDNPAAAEAFHRKAKKDLSRLKKFPRSANFRTCLFGKSSLRHIGSSIASKTTPSGSWRCGMGLSFPKSHRKPSRVYADSVVAIVR